MEMTTEQKKALAMASARARAAQAGSGGGRRGAEGRAAPEEAPFTWSGLGAQAITALAKGAVGAPGMAIDAIQGINNAGSRLVNIVDRAPEGGGVKFSIPPMPFFGNDLPNSGYLINKANEAIRPEPTIAQTFAGEQPQSFLMRQPQNTPEQYADTVGQFVGGSWLGPGSLTMKGVSGVTGGLASEAAGQAFEGTPLEGPARFVGGAAGVIAPHMIAGARGSHVPRQMVGRAMEGLDEAMLNRADFLRQVAAQQGVDLSWPEAIQQASNSGTRLSDLQRVVEFSEHGGPTMRQYYANRPQQIEAAGRAQFDRIAPQPMIPERLGPRVQQAAETEIGAVNRAINDQTRPLYQAAEPQLVPTHNAQTGQALPNAAILQNPAYREAVRYIRNDPVLGPQVAHLRDDSVGMIDAAQKVMRSQAQGLSVPGQGMDAYKGSLISQSRENVTGAARQTSPEYAQAVQEQAYLRDRYLNPLQEGPTGKMAATTDVGAQTRGLFPTAPAAQSEAGVARAIRGIRRTDPEAAEGIVRQHLETVFNEATQRLQNGQNPFGGAKFAAVAAGNPQQRRNLFAAIRALPNGDLLWRGFNRFLNIMEATGRRPTPNSMTTFNAVYQKELERGGHAGELATIAGSPQKALTFIKDGYARFRLGRNTAQLARLFTQGNVEEFRTLLRSGPATPRALIAMVRLLAQVGASTQGAPSSEPVQ
ncbi:MAG: hypothetical protein ACOZAM_15750 [Pseudomonadota bacterium]